MLLLFLGVVDASRLEWNRNTVCGRTRAAAVRPFHDKRYRCLASDTYIATLSLLSVDCAADDARVLEPARKRDSCRRQAFAISHSFASSSACTFVALFRSRTLRVLISLDEFRVHDKVRSSAGIILLPVIIFLRCVPHKVTDRNAVRFLKSMHRPGNRF